MGIEEYSPSGAAPRRGRLGKEWGIQYRSNIQHRGEPLGMEELLFQAEERGNRGIERRMHSRSSNQDRRD